MRKPRRSLVEALRWVAWRGRRGRTFKKSEFWAAFRHFGKRTKSEIWSELLGRRIVIERGSIPRNKPGRPKNLYGTNDLELLAFLSSETMVKPGLRRLKTLTSKDKNAFADSSTGRPRYLELCHGAPVLSGLAMRNPMPPSLIMNRLRNFLKANGRPYDASAVREEYSRRLSQIDVWLRAASDSLTRLLGAEADYAVVLGPAVTGGMDTELFAEVLGGKPPW
jgi:hypothetical protein